MFKSFKKKETSFDTARDPLAALLKKIDSGKRLTEEEREKSFKLFTDPKTQYRIGNKHYDKGQYQEAYSCFMYGSVYDYAPAEAFLGFMHHRGLGDLSIDFKVAIQYYEKAHEHGYPFAAKRIAYLYTQGLGLDSGIVEAKIDEWTTKALQNHDPTILFNTAYRMRFGLLTDPGEDAAEELHQTYEKVKNDHPHDSFDLFYQFKCRLPQNYERARIWNQNIANEGDPVAQHDLAYLYEHGLGGGKDYKKALELYLKAANNFEHPASMFAVAQFYNQGRGVPVDYERAMYWYKKASDKGEYKPGYYIGEMYYYGRGVPKDNEQAFQWFLRSATMGYSKAEHMTGKLYELGEGVSQDYKLALDWYFKGTPKGDGDCLYRAALLYQKGLGTPVNLMVASALFEAGAKRNHQGCISSYNALVREHPEFGNKLQTFMNNADRLGAPISTGPGVISAQFYKPGATTPSQQRTYAYKETSSSVNRRT